MRLVLFLSLATGCSEGFGTTDKGPNADADTAHDNDGDADTDTGLPDDTDDDGDGVTENEGDCDDTDEDVNPNANELPYNGVDDDCDERTPDDDLDGDGFTEDTDCNDDLDTVNPDEAEARDDGVDNDCDGDIDEAFEVAAVDESGDVGDPSGIGVDSAGTIHVIYRDVANGTIQYASDDGSGWTAATEIVSDTVTGESLDLVVDHADELQMAYTWTGGGTTDLWFGWMDASGTWDVGYLVDGYTASSSIDTGWFVSIDVDSDNLPSFAYYDNTYLVPRLADYTSFGVAVYADVDVWWYWTYWTGLYTTLAIDSDDYDHVAWYDENTLGSEGQYADYNEGTVNEAIADDAIWLSLALQSDDTACVAFQDAVSADLEYACRSGSSWSATTLDSVGSVGSYAQLAYDSADQPWIAYYDETNGDLKVAAEVAGAWSSWTVDETGDVGRSPSIAVGPDDRVHVSYYDATNGTLKIASLNE